MNNEEAVCYITYAVPARLIPTLPLGEMSVPAVQQEEEPPMIYPPGFMPEWFLTGSFPEDDYDD